MTDEEFRLRMELRKEFRDLFISQMIALISAAVVLHLAFILQEKQQLSGLDLFFITATAFSTAISTASWISTKNNIKKIMEAIECVKNRAGG